MRKLFLFFYLIAAFELFCQVDTTTVKVTLKSGAVCVGELILKNEEVIMLRNKEGAKFQFQQADVSKIETISAEQAQQLLSNPSTNSLQSENTENFCGIIDISFASASARKSFSRQTVSQFNISFGNKQALGKNIFLGLGAGYLTALNKLTNTTPKLIPVFINVLSTVGKAQISPAVGIETGYAFSANSHFGGGLFTKLSAGIIIPLNKKTALYLSGYGAVYSLKAVLTETTANGNYIYSGITAMNVGGLKIGLRF